MAVARRSAPQKGETAWAITTCSSMFPTWARGRPCEAVVCMVFGLRRSRVRPASGHVCVEGHGKTSLRKGAQVTCVRWSASATASPCVCLSMSSVMHWRNQRECSHDPTCGRSVLSKAGTPSQMGCHARPHCLIVWRGAGPLPRLAERESDRWWAITTSLRDACIQHRTPYDSACTVDSVDWASEDDTRSRTNMAKSEHTKKYRGSSAHKTALARRR